MVNSTCLNGPNNVWEHDKVLGVANDDDVEWFVGFGLLDRSVNHGFVMREAAFGSAFPKFPRFVGRKCGFESGVPVELGNFHVFEDSLPFVSDDGGSEVECFPESVGIGSISFWCRDHLELSHGFAVLWVFEKVFFFVHTWLVNEFLSEFFSGRGRFAKIQVDFVPFEVVFAAHGAECVDVTVWPFWVGETDGDFDHFGMVDSNVLAVPFEK